VKVPLRYKHRRKRRGEGGARLGFEEVGVMFSLVMP